MNCWLNSFKNVPRDSKGDGEPYHIVPNIPIPRNWKNFLRRPENKAEMFRLVREFVKAPIPGKRKKVPCTLDDDIAARPLTVRTINIVPCSHEKVDICNMLHAKDVAIQRLSSILLKATDTDIVVVCLSLFTENIYVEFGMPKNLRLLLIHEIHSSLGPTHCRSLSFFYSLTGCDAMQRLLVSER